MLPFTLQFVIAMIASAINERTRQKLDYVLEENRILKEALQPHVGRTHLRLGEYSDSTRCGCPSWPCPLSWAENSAGEDMPEISSTAMVETLVSPFPAAVAASVVDRIQAALAGASGQARVVGRQFHD